VLIITIFRSDLVGLLEGLEYYSGASVFADIEYFYESTFCTTTHYGKLLK
jgi:hypothetical protein